MHGKAQLSHKIYSLVFLTVAPDCEALLSWKVLLIKKTPSGRGDSRKLRDSKRGSEREEGQGLRVQNSSEQWRGTGLHGGYKTAESYL